MCRRISSRRTTIVAARLTRRRQHLLQPLADEPAPADRAGEQVGAIGVVHLAVVELLERLFGLAPRDVTGRFLVHLCRRPTAGRNHLLRANDTEPRRWIAHEPLPEAMANDVAGESLRRAISGSPSASNTLGSRSPFAASARWPSTAR